MRLLLISNSTNPGEAYLEHPKVQIGRFLEGISEVMFVPYAAVTFSYDLYAQKVQQRFAELGIKVRSVHRESHPAKALCEAQAIVVGGGNTFQLLWLMQQQGLVEVIRQRVRQGIPYVGWSAGSNVACPTICTTNDMPIVQPQSFQAAGLVPFQINPHYLDDHPEAHAGETRQQRIEEYIAANPNSQVVGLREGSILCIEGEELALIGPKPMRLFRSGKPPQELSHKDHLGFLLSPLV